MTQLQQRPPFGRRPRQTDVENPAPRYRRAQWIGAALILALLSALAAMLVRAGGQEAPAAPAPDGAVVAPADSGRGVRVGDTSAPVTASLYFDYLCPACGAFEAVNGDELTRLLEEGVVALELRPMAFLDHLSGGTRYSTRALGAMATVADGAPDQVWAFHRALYAAQPAEGGPGLTDGEIAAIAIDVGVPQDVVERFGDATYEPWTVAMTDRAFDDGVEGTPTILLEGQVFEGDWSAPGVLTDAILQAAGDH